MRDVKLNRKLVKKEQQKLSKQEKKRLADANWVGDTCHPGFFF